MRILLEATYKLTRYHRDENFVERVARVGYVYLILAYPMNLSLYFISNKLVGDAYFEEIKWALFGTTFVILAVMRILSNVTEYLVNGGWGFHIKSGGEVQKIKKNYIESSLKPRIQGILLSLLFIIVVYITLKSLLIVVADQPLIIPKRELGLNDFEFIVSIFFGACVVALFSETILRIFQPFVQE
ncbi:hypothetical protein [Archaeoglobus veneficus]|nr:hypothetical protein [Archaeoglobus veneficus]